MMMKTKTIKNTLLQAVAYGPHADFTALRLKASFHASPAAIMALLQSTDCIRAKTSPFGLKNRI